MKEERDRFLTGAMGACWHAYDLEKPMMTYSLVGYVCEKCNNFILANNDFSMAEDFAKLWKWAGGQDFLGEFVARSSIGLEDGSMSRDEVADGIYEFLKERTKGSSTPAS
jgi:hypothetical protein